MTEIEHIDIIKKYQIESLSNLRYNYLDEYYTSWNEETNEYGEDEPKEIDELSNQILDSIKKWRNELSFEFIIEELTKLGWAPSLLYDDNGHFSIMSDGVQSVAKIDKEDMELIYFVKKDKWKDSIREALNDYLDNE